MSVVCSLDAAVEDLKEFLIFNGALRTAEVACGGEVSVHQVSQVHRVNDLLRLCTLDGEHN